MGGPAGLQSPTTPERTGRCHKTVIKRLLQGIVDTMRRLTNSTTNIPAVQGLRLTTEKAMYADAKRGRFEPHKIAVLVPCYNEEATVAKVVADFRAAVPAAESFCFRNNATRHAR